MQRHHAFTLFSIEMIKVWYPYIIKGKHKKSFPTLTIPILCVMFLTIFQYRLESIFPSLITANIPCYILFPLIIVYTIIYSFHLCQYLLLLHFVTLILYFLEYCLSGFGYLNNWYYIETSLWNFPKYKT